MLAGMLLAAGVIVLSAGASAQVVPILVEIDQIVGTHTRYYDTGGWPPTFRSGGGDGWSSGSGSGGGGNAMGTVSVSASFNNLNVFAELTGELTNTARATTFAAAAASSYYQGSGLRGISTSTSSVKARNTTARSGS